MKRSFYIHNIYTLSEPPSSEELSFIPSSLRRRMSNLQKGSLFLAKKAITEDASNLKVVFASEHGEWGQAFKLFSQFAEEGELSPTVFSHSVHNAVPGLGSLIFNNKQPYNAISAGTATLEMGFLEAVLNNALLVYAEEDTPEFYKGHVPEVSCLGLSLIVSDKANAFHFELEGESNKESEFSITSLNELVSGVRDNLKAKTFILRRL